MPISFPPRGYVGIIDAEKIAGVTGQTIIAAARRGELAALHDMKNSPWYFSPAELIEWRQWRQQAKNQFATSGRS